VKNVRPFIRWATGIKIGTTPLKFRRQTLPSRAPRCLSFTCKGQVTHTSCWPGNRRRSDTKSLSELDRTLFAIYENSTGKYTSIVCLYNILYSLLGFNIINLTWTYLFAPRSVLTSVVTVFTEKILDMFNPIGFWVRATQQSGLIEVGKFGESLPFIFWIDPEPIPIKYYSFTSWGAAICKWMFRCKPDSFTVMSRTGYNKIHK